MKKFEKFSMFVAITSIVVAVIVLIGVVAGFFMTDVNYANPKAQMANVEIEETKVVTKKNTKTVNTKDIELLWQAPHTIKIEANSTKVTIGNPMSAMPNFYVRRQTDLHDGLVESGQKIALSNSDENLIVIARNNYDSAVKPDSCVAHEVIVKDGLDTLMIDNHTIGTLTIQDLNGLLGKAVSTFEPEEGIITFNWCVENVFFEATFDQDETNTPIEFRVFVY